MANISQTGNRWEISGEVGMDTANSLLQASTLLAMEDETQIDFAQVSDVDTAALSLILEWKRRAMRDNKQIKLVNVPQSLDSLSHLYGVAEMIN